MSEAILLEFYLLWLAKVANVSWIHSRGYEQTNQDDRHDLRLS